MPGALPALGAGSAPTAATAGSAGAAAAAIAGTTVAPGAQVPPHLLGSGTRLVDLPPLDGRRSRWPLVVALIAAAAIVVCVVLLLSDSNESKAGGVKRRAVPAPDRMETSPLPPPPALDPDVPSDPWADPGSAPQGTAPPPPSPTPLPGGAVPPPEQFQTEMFKAACERLSQCGLSDISQFCDTFSSFSLDDYYADQIKAGRCDYDQQAAQRCLDGIRSVPCLGGSSFDIDQLSTVLTQVSACSTALTCH
ncbi:MAG: hypothetical protein H6708_23450 [Kofleriaceae bacterium]|nr:hypothetical protein [Kofleriaceae bacterium]